MNPQDYCTDQNLTWTFLKVIATWRCFKGEIICIRNLYSICAEVSSGSYHSSLGLCPEAEGGIFLKDDQK